MDHLAPNLASVNGLVTQCASASVTDHASEILHDLDAETESHDSISLQDTAPQSDQHVELKAAYRQSAHQP